MIPSPAECLRLMADYQMLQNIRAHSLVVATIADFLALALCKQGQEIDVELAVAAALMHDIGKSFCLDNDRNHALLGRDICLQHDLHELAPLVAQHVVLDDHSFPTTPLSAKELVYYADKRVNHDQVVSLDQRMAYIIDRYGQNDPHRFAIIRQNFERCQRIEAAIFSSLDFGPADLAERLAVFPSNLAQGMVAQEVECCEGRGCQ
jgi:putative nucleotidyltransferase with HDIG domain